MRYKNSQKTTVNSQDIEKLRNGDIDAFERIYRLYVQALLEFANYYVHSIDNSENIIQDVFFYLWKNKKKLKPDTNIKSYLYTAVKNKSLNFKRYQKIKKNYVDTQILLPEPEVETPEDIIIRSELESAIEKAIRKLPEKRGIIFCMHRFEKLTYKEIADIQNISIKTVETQIKRSVLFILKQISPLLK